MVISKQMLRQESGALLIKSRECPQGVTSNEGLGVMLDPLNQSRNGRSRSNIRGYDRGVAKQSSAFWTSQRSAAKSIAKLFVGRNRKHFDQIEPRPCAGRRFELGPSSFLGEPIERTHVLAHVATEDPFADCLAQVPRNRTLVLDRQIRNTSIRIQLIWSYKRIGRARIDTAAARPATDLHFVSVSGKVEVEQDLRQKEPRTIAWLNQVRVLTEEAKPGARGNGPLEQRHRIDKASRVNLAAGKRFDAAHKRVQPRLDDIVIIQSPRVTGHTAVPRFVVELRSFGIVIDGKRYQGSRSRHERARMSVQLGSASHVIHACGITRLAPVMKRRVITLKRLNRSDARHFESNLACRLFDLFDELAHS